MGKDRVEVNGAVVSLEVNSRAGIIHGLQSPVPPQRLKALESPIKA